MLKFRECSVPIYRGVFQLIVTDSPKKLQKIIPEASANIYAHAWFYNGPEYQVFAIVLNPFSKGRDLAFSTIAHEVEHIKNMIFEARDVRADLDNDEPAAYLVEALYEQTIKWLDEMKLLKHIKPYFKDGY